MLEPFTSVGFVPQTLKKEKQNKKEFFYNVYHKSFGDKIRRVNWWEIKMLQLKPLQSLKYQTEKFHKQSYFLIEYFMTSLDKGVSNIHSVLLSSLFGCSIFLEPILDSKIVRLLSFFLFFTT